jgi:hypothetical protein
MHGIVAANQECGNFERRQVRGGHERLGARCNEVAGRDDACRVETCDHGERLLTQARRQVRVQWSQDLHTFVERAACRSVHPCEHRLLLFGVASFFAGVDRLDQDKPEGPAGTSNREPQSDSRTAGHAAHKSPFDADVIQKKFDVVRKLVEGQGTSAPRPSAPAKIGSNHPIPRRQRCDESQRCLMIGHTAMQHDDDGTAAVLNRELLNAATGEIPDLANTDTQAAIHLQSIP